MRVGFPIAVKARLFAEASRADPHECCGLFQWVLTSEGLIIQALVPLANRAPNPMGGFSIGRAQFRRARERLRGAVGIYHSHPTGPALASGADRRAMARRDGLYLICDTLGDVALYTARAGGLRTLFQGRLGGAVR